jgi:HlyD family secretion protein
MKMAKYSHTNEQEKEKTMKSRIISLTILMMAAALIASACGSVGTPQAPTATPGPVTDTSGIVAEGKLLPDPSVELAFTQPGVVSAVLVKQGDTVAAEQVLAQLVGSESAQAALEAARIQYTTALDAALDQEKKTRLADWFPDNPGQFDQNAWYFTRDEQIKAAQAEVEAAQAAIDEAQAELTDIEQDLDAAEFLRAEERLAQARVAYEVAKEVNANAQNAKGNTTGGRRKPVNPAPKVPKEPRKLKNDVNMKDAGKTLYDDAHDELVRAQEVYNDLLSSQAAEDVLDARAKVAVTYERYYTAMDHLRALQTGERSLDVSAAQAAVDEAEAALSAYELRAPIDGTVLSVDVSTGEAAGSGVPLVFLGDTAHWKVETKDLAEVDVAGVALGAPVVVKLDAYPGEAFRGKVVAIDPVGREYLGDMTYKVTIALDQPDPRFMWNMTATVTIEGK